MASDRAEQNERQQNENVLRIFVGGDIADETFEPGIEYAERLVDERLWVWCADPGRTGTEPGFGAQAA
ncbi:hypothetical protein [Streptomyces graminilatus]|uniref:hypothetical protein n=1 Tax=Streptomyces graminilatus TaxID=1464070 RepID=UPI0006E43DD3|nr:hypothetical protein [Streptomyces graminilatus]